MDRTPFTGQIIHVADGDTLTVEKDFLPITIRLHHIDAPEKTEPFALPAKNFVIKNWLLKEVKVWPITIDRYGRTVAIVKGNKEENLSAQMLLSGLAFWYRRFSHDTQYKFFESIARENKVNLWSHTRYFQNWLKNRCNRLKIEAESPLPDNRIEEVNGFYVLPHLTSMTGIETIEEIEIGINRISHRERNNKVDSQR